MSVLNTSVSGGGDVNIIEDYHNRPSFAVVSGGNIVFNLPSRVKQLIYVTAVAGGSAYGEGSGFASVGTAEGTAHMQSMVIGSHSTLVTSYDSPPIVDGNQVILKMDADSLNEVSFASYAYIPED